jgi:hypothetical protein
MGINDHQADKRNRAAKRARTFQPSEKVSASDIETELLRDVVGVIVAHGGALRIGVTRDGGAWAFGIYGDGGDPHTEYVRPSEDVNAYLRDLGAFFNALGEEA